jgi:hypothetical protein|tara:strand:+ start:4112 stop:4300 length:189 start_codon:yes stop_codon:yes gene_type:complete
MTTHFTDVYAAIEEADYIVETLRKKVYLVTDKYDLLYAVTADQYNQKKWRYHRVLETFKVQY